MLFLAQSEGNHQYELRANWISKWMKLVHLKAYVTRFITNCRANKEKLKSILNSSEIKNSEEVIIKLVRKESFNEEYTLLLNNDEIKNGRLKDTIAHSLMKTA